MYKIYGIKNCDTMKKALNWLNDNKVEFEFHNYKTEGLSPELLQSFIDLVGWQPLLNTKGTTWRKLDEATRQSIDNEVSAKALMLENTSIIKRPLLVKGKKALLGFSTDGYQQFIKDMK